jgi:phosphatidylinositol alpha-1,6-mannosyltransferase
MQKLSYQLYQEIRRQRVVVGLVRDCPTPLLPVFLSMAFWWLLRHLAFSRREVRIVHFGDPVMALFAPLCIPFRVPTVVTVHGLDITFTNFVYQAMVRLCLRSATHIVAISQAARQACLGRGVSPVRCTIIRPGIEPMPHPKRQAAKNKLAEWLDPGLADAPILLGVGRLVRRKGFAWFVERVLPFVRAEVPSVRLLIVGDGSEREAIVESAVRGGVSENVLLVGQVNEARLRLCYSAADVFVMPNVRVEGDVEGFGLVALEAAVAGLPVVAAGHEGILDAIQDGVNGRLIPPEDATTFAKTLLELIRNPIERQLLGQQGASYTREAFSWAAMAERYAVLYDQVSANRAARPKEVT